MNKLSGETMDLVQHNIEGLKQMFPEVVTEGKIDFEKLKLLLGEEIEIRNEKYEFTWNGKADAIKLAQTPSMGTLIPDKESSKNWDTTENLYIEGDNLEVLKLLQKSYFGKVKMIYIDPPYNTGKDFVYKDNFRDNIQNYKEQTEQTTKANAETSGRYHTDWLNMMYPRLKLARNLLKEDGVIFISIDDNESNNLKKICDEIFGEDNFISSIIWQKKTGASDAKGIATITENILVYIKNSLFVANTFSKNKDSYDVNRYRYQDEFIDTRGPYYIDNLDRGGLQYSDSLNYGINCPDGTITFPNGRYKFVNDGWIWKWSKKKVEWAIKNKFIEFRKSDKKESGWAVCYKNYLFVDNEGKEIERAAPHKNLVTNILNANAATNIKNLFGGNIFKYSKPVELIELLTSFIVINDNDIILDFFSGSGTTAQAIINQNLNNITTKCKFILIQLPEKILGLESNEYATICEIGKERIRRAGDKIVEESGKTDLDIGFKVFKLETSNIKEWNGTVENIQDLIQSLESNLVEGRTTEDLLYEILLKIGLPLTSSIEEISVADKKVYDVAFGSVLLCLEDDITLDVVNGMLSYVSEDIETKVIFKEIGFVNDTVKTNAIQTLKKHGIKEENIRSV